MLGNWSCGDNCKEEAIKWAWELLTEVYRLPTDHIYVSYFAGDTKSGLEADNETRDAWLKFLPPGSVLPFGYNDNFSEMGGTRLSGPCTKIHCHRVGNPNAASLVDMGDQTCIELWNLAFIELDKDSNGSLKPLPTKYVGTRMNLESLTALLQNRMSSYTTDIFLPIYDHIHKATGAKEYDGKMGHVTEAYRVVADHLRTISFAIADGLRPGNVGREYALRRVFLRAVCYGMQFLDGKEGFFSGVARCIVLEMGETYQELKMHEETISTIIKQEESDVCKIMQLVMDFNMDDLRDNALIELVQVTESFKDLPILLWYSKGTVTVLLMEIMSISPESLNGDQSTRLSNLLRLIKGLAYHSETRAFLIKASMHSYLFHFIRAIGTNLPTAIVQRHCLAILQLLVKVDDPNEINTLLKDGVVSVCIHFLIHGSDGRLLEVALSILKSLLSTEVGLDFITKEREGFLEVADGLDKIIHSELVHTRVKCLKVTVECYFLISTNTRACEELALRLPLSLRNGTLLAQIGSAFTAQETLTKLLQNVFNAQQRFHRLTCP